MIRERKRTERTAPSASYSGALLSVAERIGANRRARLAAWFEAQRLGVRLSMVLGMCAVVLLIGFAGVASVDCVTEAPIRDTMLPGRTTGAIAPSSINLVAEFVYPNTDSAPQLKVIEEQLVTVPPGEVYRGPFRTMPSSVYNYLANTGKYAPQNVTLDWVQRSVMGGAAHRIPNPQLIQHKGNGQALTVISMVEALPSGQAKPIAESTDHPTGRSTPAKPYPVWLNSGEYSFAASYSLSGMFARVGSSDVGVWNIFGRLTEDLAPTQFQIAIRLPVMLSNDGAELAIKHVQKEAKLMGVKDKDGTRALGGGFTVLGTYTPNIVQDGDRYLAMFPVINQPPLGSELILEMKVQRNLVAGVSETGRSVRVGGELAG